MACSPEEVLKQIEAALQLQVEGSRKSVLLAHLEAWAKELLNPTPEAETEIPVTE